MSQVIPWDYVLDWLFAAGMFGLAVFVAYHHKSLEKLDEEQIAVRDDDAIMAVCAVSEDMVRFRPLGLLIWSSERADLSSAGERSYRPEK